MYSTPLPPDRIDFIDQEIVVFWREGDRERKEGPEVERRKEEGEGRGGAATFFFFFL